MPLQATSGAASYDAFGGGAAVAPKYIEDFFQTWLRTGTGSSATVTTGLNASINKSLVWTKSRSAATNHKLTDTVRGVTKALSSNTTSAEATDSQGLTAFSSTGYTIGTNTDYNNSGATYVDWQWLATPKFFDVVTYTGNGVDGRTVAHNLQSTPGAFIVKRTDSTSDWVVWHRSLPQTPAPFPGYLTLNTTNAVDGYDVGLGATSTHISVADTTGASLSTNVNGATYVAYIFAHDAGGFGLTGTDNVISCGSYTGNGSTTGPVINLGYEPQWVLIKDASSGSPDWWIFDNMRGVATGGVDMGLRPNTSGAEVTGNDYLSFTATGFQPTNTTNTVNASGDTYIYIAIRRGPMKVPTTGTSVFNPVLASTTAPTFRSSNFTGGIDSALVFYKPGYDDGTNAYANWQSRLTGTGQLQTPNTRAEISQSYNLWDYMNGQNNTSGLGTDWGAWLFKRAPGFHDVVCYTGTGSARTVAHNLTVVPEMMICKARTTGGSGPYNWTVYHTALSAGGFAYLNLTNAGVFSGNTSFWNGAAPTASVFSLGGSSGLNQSGLTFVNCLFASCPGVSKVGSYTGTGATQVINCGFTTGARFVLIKATSTTGDWYVWDSARGIVAGNDPYLELNTADAEVTNTDWVDTAASGFELSNAGGNLANSNGVTYIYLAIA